MTGGSSRRARRCTVGVACAGSTRGDGRVKGILYSPRHRSRTERELGRLDLECDCKRHDHTKLAQVRADRPYFAITPVATHPAADLMTRPTPSPVVRVGRAHLAGDLGAARGKMVKVKNERRGERGAQRSAAIGRNESLARSTASCHSRKRDAVRQSRGEGRSAKSHRLS